MERVRFKFVDSANSESFDEKKYQPLLHVLSDITNARNKENLNFLEIGNLEMSVIKKEDFPQEDFNDYQINQNETDLVKKSILEIYSYTKLKYENIFITKLTVFHNNEMKITSWGIIFSLESVEYNLKSNTNDCIVCEDVKTKEEITIVMSNFPNLSFVPSDEM